MYIKSNLFSGSSVPVTPVTTPTSGASVIPSTGGTLAEFTVRIVSDSFVYLRVTRADYRQLRNHFEMRKAQEAEKVNSADNINQEQQQPPKTENGQVGNDQGTRGVSRRNTFHNTLVELLGR